MPESVTPWKLTGPNFLSLSLTIAALVCWLLFFVEIGISALYLKGYCLHTYWLADNASGFTPFAVTGFMIVALGVWSVTVFIAGWIRANRSSLVTGAVVAVVCGFWLIAMEGLSQAMLFELGHVSEVEWYADDFWGAQWWIAHGEGQACNPGVT